MGKQSRLKILLNGLIKENPVLVLVLGTCPTLAVTTSVVNGVGMGIGGAYLFKCGNFYAEEYHSG